MLQHPVALLPVPTSIGIGRDHYHADDRQIRREKENQPQDHTDRWQPRVAAWRRLLDDGWIGHDDARENTRACWLEKTNRQSGRISKMRFSGCCTGRIVQPTLYLVQTS